MHDKPAPNPRAALTSAFIALAAVGIALSSLLVASIALKETVIVVALLLLAAAGASLAIALASAKPPREQ